MHGYNMVKAKIYYPRYIYVYKNIKHSLAHLQDLIPTVADIKYICKTHQPKWGLNLVDVLEHALFVHAFGFKLYL